MELKQNHTIHFIKYFPKLDCYSIFIKIGWPKLQKKGPMLHSLHTNFHALLQDYIHNDKFDNQLSL